MQQTACNVDEIQRSSLSDCTPVISGAQSITETLSRQDLRKWLSPPNPSVNHNTVHNTQHEGTATWFFRGGIYEKWRSTPSLLWIHGKRTVLFPFTTLHSKDSCLYSWFWKERPLVRDFAIYPALMN